MRGTEGPAQRITPKPTVWVRSYLSLSPGQVFVLGQGLGAAARSTGRSPGEGSWWALAHLLPSRAPETLTLQLPS